ncbi:MAG: hypothetical protein ACI8TS_000435 [Flavobacteriales bacterium]|jgi:hypothetical protein
MKKYIPILGLLCFLAAMTNSSLAQDNTRGFSGGFYSSKAASITVVPFTPRMLISDIHRDMCFKNEMSTKEVQAALAEGFCHAMRVAKPDRAESTVYGWEDEWPEALNTFYGELGYEVKRVIDSPADPSKPGVFISEGELRMRRDTVSRYMSAVIDSTIISALATETKSNFILVVTQLDIVNLGDPIRVNPEGAALFVRLHYTLFNPEGKDLKGGLVKSALSNATYEPTTFAREEFIEAAKELYAEVSTILIPEIQTEN